MKKLFSLILVFILCFNSLIYAKSLTTSTGTYSINIYNIAIVGNSHASYMSRMVGVDNDLGSLTLGNHSIAGNEFSSAGVLNDAEGKNGIVAKKGDAKNWITEFINDSKYIDYAILFFGSNLISSNINSFETSYRNFVKQVNPDCKLILMALPYGDYNGTSDPGKNHTWKDYEKKENIDKFSAIIKKIASEFSNCYYEEIPLGMTYSDYVHMDSKSYKTIYEQIKTKYKFPEIKIVNQNSSNIANNNQNNSLIGNVAYWEKEGNYWYYYKNGQKLKSQWVSSEGYWYYLDDTGKMLTNTITPDGYYVDEEGKWIQNNNQQKEIISTISSNLSKTYSSLKNIDTEINNGNLIIYIDEDVLEEGDYYDSELKKYYHVNTRGIVTIKSSIKEYTEIENSKIIKIGNKQYLSGDYK